MRTGQIVTKDKVNDHLSGTYIEVFPQGTMADVDLIASIPKEHKTYSKQYRSNAPTPILVRLSYWETVRPDKCPTIDLSQSVKPPNAQPEEPVGNNLTGSAPDAKLLRRQKLKKKRKITIHGMFSCG